MAHIEEIAQHEGRSVTLRGWLHNRRSSGKIHFLTVRDGTGFIQAVMSQSGGRGRRCSCRRDTWVRRPPSWSRARCEPTRGRPAATSSM